MCGVDYCHKEKRDTSKYYFDPSFVVIDTAPGIQSYDHINDCGNVYDTEVLVISTVLGTFGILTVSLLAIIGFLFLKLRRVTTATTDVNPLLYIKKEVADLEDSEKKDTFERETTNLSKFNGLSSQEVGIDHKLPDTIKSRENGTHIPY